MRCAAILSFLDPQVRLHNQTRENGRKLATLEFSTRGFPAPTASAIGIEIRAVPE